MKRIYADLPKFKRVHQSLMEMARQHDVVIGEIDRALSGRRTAAEKAALEETRRKCLEAKKQYMDMVASFVAAQG